jgi:carboxylesterase type B
MASGRSAGSKSTCSILISDDQAGVICRLDYPGS